MPSPSAASWAVRRGEPGADDGARGQLAEREAVASHEHVAAVLAHRHGGDDEPRLGRRRQVLERVHGDVDATVEQGAADGCGEDAGAADGGEQLTGHVALGRDLDELDLVAGLAQAVGHPAGLGGGEGRAARAEAQGAHGWARLGGVDTLATSLGSRSKSSRRAAA